MIHFTQDDVVAIFVSWQVWALDCTSRADSSNRMTLSNLPLRLHFRSCASGRTHSPHSTGNKKLTPMSKSLQAIPPPSEKNVSVVTPQRTVHHHRIILLLISSAHCAADDDSTLSLTLTLQQHTLCAAAIGGDELPEEAHGIA